MLEIREMDDRYILDTCPLSDPLDPSIVSGEPYNSSLGHSKEVRRRFFRQVREQYGNCVLFAWDQDKIVGFLLFFPKYVARRVGVKTLPGDQTRSEQTLVYGCMQMASDYRGKGVGTKLAQALVAWAREHGWKRIEVTGVARGDSEEHWRWGWALPKWQKLGFKVAREQPSIAVVLDLTDSSAEPLRSADADKPRV
jgi:GNAT superfamily N-acetyltransferase